VLISGQIIQPSVGEVVTAEVTHWILMLWEQLWTS
jgi:hypothetical protein